MRNDIAFKAEDGVTLRGWHYLPDQRSGRLPTIVMAHGFSAVKEMFWTTSRRRSPTRVSPRSCSTTGTSAPAMASRGRRSIRGDRSGDYRDAITFAETLNETDKERIGIWGSSYSGGHVLVVGAIDRRVKCVVSQVPLISGHALARRLIRSDMIAGLTRMFEDDRRARYAGKPPAMIPVVSENPAGPAALPTADSWTFFTETGRTRAPAWKNEVTLRSIEMFMRIRTRRLYQPHKSDATDAGRGTWRPSHRRGPCPGSL